MPRQKLLIPEAPLERIFKGIENIRVSKECLQYLSEYLYNEAKRISIKAAEIAKHRNSRTINGGDIKLSV